MEDLLATLDADAINARGFRIVVDYSQSAASLVLPMVLGTLGVEAVTAHPYSGETAVPVAAPVGGARPGEAARRVGRRRLRRRPRRERRAHLPRRRPGARSGGRAGAAALPQPAQLGRTTRAARLPDDGDEPRRGARRGTKLEVVGHPRRSPRSRALRPATASSSPARSAAASSSRTSSRPTTASPASASFSSCSRPSGLRCRSSSRELPGSKVVHRQVRCPWGRRARSCGSSRSGRRGRRSTPSTGSRSSRTGWVQVLPDPDEPLVHVYAEGQTGRPNGAPRRGVPRRRGRGRGGRGGGEAQPKASSPG